jgi:hypothetical protein
VRNVERAKRREMISAKPLEPMHATRSASDT